MTARTRLETGIARGWPLPPSDVALVLDALDERERAISRERTRADAAEADRDALRAECERMGAIVEGSTTAPTRDEVDVHFATGGRWILRWSDGTFGTARGPCAVADASEPGILTAVRWWPLDRDGRPCAWPVTP